MDFSRQLAVSRLYLIPPLAGYLYAEEPVSLYPLSLLLITLASDSERMLFSAR